MQRNRRPRKNRYQVDSITHTGETRVNIPTSDLASFVTPDVAEEIRVAYERRNRGLDPQLVWRGKDAQDVADLVVNAPPLFIEEKVQPKALIDDLMRYSGPQEGDMVDMFADFNGLPAGADRTEFYRHQANWTNRMILGDSLQVMASLAEREGLRGKVQCIYVDPPYGIRFNSNFQWSTTSRDVRDGNVAHITREPEQVKAFRDTWRDGVHSYLSYLRDRLTVAKDLLSDSGSCFVQIGDENVHLVRAVLDEVFGEWNFIGQITFLKTTSATAAYLSGTADYLLWYGRDIATTKFRKLWRDKEPGEEGGTQYRIVRDISALRGQDFDPDRFARLDQLTSQSGPGQNPDFRYQGIQIGLNRGSWKTNPQGMERLKKANRLGIVGRTPEYLRFLDDFPVFEWANVWTDTRISGFGTAKQYVVQTLPKVVGRCILMTTDPGDLVLDPTCGSGTTAYVAEQWGRRWITIDTSRVALALARARIMGARYPWYLLVDSQRGIAKEAQVTGRSSSGEATYGDVRQGFVHERVPHIQLRDIANNAEIDVIWETRQPAVEAALARLNEALRGHTTPLPVATGGRAGQEVDFAAPGGATVTMPSGEHAPVNELLEWEVPYSAPDGWPAEALDALAAFREARAARQREIDASIAANAAVELLYDRPYEDRTRVRVAGPFTVEKLSPHRMESVDEAEAAAYVGSDPPRTLAEAGGGVRYQGPAPTRDFAADMLEQLRHAGVQQAHKEDRIRFSSVTPTPSNNGYVCAEARFTEGGEEDGVERRAGVFIGPEFGTVSRSHLVAAAREAQECGFDMLIACAFSFDAQSSDLNSLGPLPILKARMNADLHMAELKTTDRANLFVVFGEPDVRVEQQEDGWLRVRVAGIDVYRPLTGQVESSSEDEIACWFVDTDYGGESFFVRHAYFLGAADPYKALRPTLRAEINAEAWASLHSAVSRPFPRPESGRIAVKVINHLGDEVMKVLSV